MDTKLDLTFAQIVADQMDDYVHAEVLFYPVGTNRGMQLPPLSIGNWLETEWRLNALGVTSAALDAARTEVKRVRTGLPELYQNKVRREFKSRMDSWALWLDEQNNAPDGQRAYTQNPVYPSQVHMRLKLELLKNDVPQLAAQLLRLSSADADLRRHLWKPGTFVWEPELQAAAPKLQWWWLYAAEPPPAPKGGQRSTTL
jgi:hypothetical protein